MRQFLFAALVSAGAILAAGPAFGEGAPFCAVHSYGTNCWYYNLDDCQRAAGRDGACIVNRDRDNPRAPSMSTRRQSGPPFCVVTSYGTNCWYYHRDACERAAAQSRGACVVNQ